MAPPPTPRLPDQRGGDTEDRQGACARPPLVFLAPFGLRVPIETADKNALPLQADDGIFAASARWKGNARDGWGNSPMWKRTYSIEIPSAPGLRLAAGHTRLPLFAPPGAPPSGICSRHYRSAGRRCMPLSTKAGPRFAETRDDLAWVESRCVEAITSRSEGTVGIFAPRDAHSGGENQAVLEKSHARVQSYHLPRLPPTWGSPRVRARLDRPGASRRDAT